MNRPGDATVMIAVDATTPIEFTYETDDVPPMPIDVTGYSARSEFLVYDGTPYGRVLYEPTVTVGATDGLFSVELTTNELADLLNSSPQGEPARFRVFITPQAADEIELAHGALRILGPGVVVSDTDVSITRDDFTVTVHAVGARGPAGPQGDQGPQGDPGGLDPQDGSITTTSTNAALITTFTVELSKKFSAWVSTQARTATPNVRTQDSKVTGACNVAGVVTLDPPFIESDGFDLGIVSFAATGASGVVGIYANPRSTTSTQWLRSSFQLETAT